MRITGQSLAKFKYVQKNKTYMNSKIVFVDSKLQEEFSNLKDSKKENKQLYNWIITAFEKIEENPFCGIQIPKKLIPKEYLTKYQIKNLWKCNLPQGWRLLYTVKNNNVVILSIVIEWMSHKDYENKFNY